MAPIGTEGIRTVSTPTVFIFGATGAVGGALVNELLPDHKAGRLNLVAAVRRPEAVAALENQGLETRRIDLDRAELEGLTPVVDAMRGANRVFLLTSYDVKMLAQSKAAIDAAKVVGVSHMVHIGPMRGQTPRPFTPAGINWWRPT